MKSEGHKGNAGVTTESHDKEKSKTSSVIRATYLFLVLDVTCLFMQLGIIPYMVKKMGLSLVWFGYLQTTFGIFQLIGGPVFGRFGDLFGARNALTIASSSAALCFFLLAMSSSATLLFLSRIPSIFMHGLPGAQMVLTDLSSPAERADALGKLGLCFGIGMIVGPSLGGVLSTRFGESCPAFVAAFGSVLNVLLVTTCIPARTKPLSAAASDQQKMSKASSVFNLGEITRLLKFPGVLKIFIIKIVAGLPTGLFMVMFSVICMNFFGLKAEHTGYLMSYFGVTQMIIQGLVIGRLTQSYSDETLLRVSIAMISVVGLAKALMTSMIHFCIIVLPLMLSFSMLAVISDSMLTKSVPASDTGAMLGLCSSVQSLTRTVGPTIGGYLYHNYGVPSFGCLQFGVNFILFLYLLKNKLNHREDKQIR